MEDDYVPAWLPTGVAYELAKYLVDSKGGIEEPIGQRLIGLAIAGKVVAICRNILGVERIPADELEKIRSLEATMDEEEFQIWSEQNSKKRDAAIRKTLPEYKLLSPAFWLHFQDEVKLPYNVAHSSTNWKGGGSFGYSKTGVKDANGYSPFYELFDDEFDMRLASDVFFLEDTTYHVTVPPKEWKWLNSPEFDRENFKISETSSLLEHRKRNATGLEVAGEKTKKLKGGRRGAKHGDAIASMTLKLAKLHSEELDLYTVDSLSLDLKDEYLKISETPPSQQNLERYSAGILRVLRKQLRTI